jgi:hypothetical protein
MIKFPKVVTQSSYIVKTTYHVLSGLNLRGSGRENVFNINKLTCYCVVQEPVWRAACCALFRERPYITLLREDPAALLRWSRLPTFQRLYGVHAVTVILCLVC